MRNVFDRTGNRYWFTLVELIVVITILAILVTIGFLALSGYSSDAQSSAIKANARAVFSTIVNESARNSVSPRQYVVHQSWFALSWASANFNGTSVTFVWWDSNDPSTNYSAGTPNYQLLKLDPKKFNAFKVRETNTAFADTNVALSAGSLQFNEIFANGKIRGRSYSQVVGVLPDSNAVVIGDYPTWVFWNPQWLIRTPGDLTWTAAITEWQSVSTYGVSNQNTDPHFANVKLLAHLDNSTLDSAWYVATWSTPFMNFSNAEKKFWSHAFHSPDNSGYNLKKYSDAGFSFGTSTDFTIEWWFRLSANVTKHSIFCLGDSWDYGAGSSISLYYTNAGALVVRPAGMAFWSSDSLITWSVPLNQWVHVALSRQWSDLRLFVNGTQVGTTYVWTIDINKNALALFSYNSANNPFLGYADELRVTKWTARYVTDFATPTSEFPSE